MAGPQTKSSNSTQPVSFPPDVASLLGLVISRIHSEQTVEEDEQAKRAEDEKWALAAVADPYVWATQHTKTYNPHWIEEGRPSPDEVFPDHAYLKYVFELLDAEQVIWWEKSRDMMLSWACVAYFTNKAMVTPYREVLFQTQKDKKVIQLVDYAKQLYRSQDARIKNLFPLSKNIELQSDHELNFSNGSRVLGIPGGADQIRSYHPWGYLNDESSFQPDAGECYNEAISAVKGKIVFNSSAGPGWYADARRDIIRNDED